MYPFSPEYMIAVLAVVAVVCLIGGVVIALVRSGSALEPPPPDNGPRPNRSRRGPHWSNAWRPPN
jgi:uncharacterized membrane protein YagU involved in acid resistance